MILKGHGPLGSRDLATEIMRQRDVLRQHRELQKSLKARIYRLEQSFNIKSEHLHAAIENGELQEIEEICNWIIDYDTLRRSGSTI